MYTEADLQAALDAKDFGLVAKISSDLAKAAKPAAKPKAKPKAAPPAKKKTKPKSTLPAPTDPPKATGSSWLAPTTLNPSGKNYGEFVSGKPDPKKLKLLSVKDAVNLPNLTAAQKKIEAAKRQPRDEGLNRPPAERREIECDGCGRTFEVYPNQLSQRAVDTGVSVGAEVFYKCDKCVKRGGRRS